MSSMRKCSPESSAELNWHAQSVCKAMFSPSCDSERPIFGIVRSVGR
jgi:hypothetical protein